MTRRLCMLGVAAVLGLGACGGGKTAAPTTTTTTASSVATDGPVLLPAGCPTGITIGQPHHADPSCFPAMLDALLRDQHVTYDHTLGPQQAASLCRRMESSGNAKGAELAILADWATGASPSPVPNPADQSTFIPIAVAVYCPAMYPAIT